MPKITRPRFALLTLATAALATGVSSCGEDTMTLERPLVYSFKHQLPDSYEKNHDLSSPEVQKVTDNSIVFIGVAIKDPKSPSDIIYDMGIKFETMSEGRSVFVESVHLETPELSTRKDVNELVPIDNPSRTPGMFWKRFMAIQGIAGDDIPLTADYFTLNVNYKLDDGPTKQMSIRMDNASFYGPVL